MSFTSENGYLPVSIETIMDNIRLGINTEFGTAYTAENFIGSGFYKYFYAAAQELQANEVKTSEIFLRLQQYITVTNEAISNPVATAPGVIGALNTAGYVASVKPPQDADAGKIFIAVDVKDNHARGLFTITSFANLVSGTDDVLTVGVTGFTAQTGSATLGTGTFQAATSNDASALSLATQINAHATAGALVEAWAIGAIVYVRAKTVGTGGNSIALGYTNNDGNVGATKSGTTLTGGAATTPDYDDSQLEIATIIKNSVAAGIVSQGTEITPIVLSNGQSFDFKYNLPNRTEVLLRLTLTLSDNNQSVVLSPTEVKTILLANIAARYSLGRDFEPQRYFNTSDAPWAAQVLLEWSIDGGSTWNSTIYEANYDDLFEILLENITVIEV